MRGLCCAGDITDSSWCVTSFVKQRSVLLGFAGAFSLQEQLQHLLGKCPGLKATEFRKCLCFPQWSWSSSSLLLLGVYFEAYKAGRWCGLASRKRSLGVMTTFFPFSSLDSDALVRHDVEVLLACKILWGIQRFFLLLFKISFSVKWQAPYQQKMFLASLLGVQELNLFGVLNVRKTVTKITTFWCS